MSFPGIKIGDVITLDDEVLEVSGHMLSQDSWWLKNLDTTNYYHLWMQSTYDLQQAYAQGRLKFGKYPKPVGGEESHWHIWTRYKGLNKVVHVCSCGAEKPINWMDLYEADLKP